MIVCDSRGCGCERSHVGLNSGAPSTVLMVRDVDLDTDDLVVACAGFLEVAWASVFDGPDELREEASAIVADCLGAASEFEVGTVLRPLFCRDGDEWDYFTERWKWEWNHRVDCAQ